MKKKESYVYSGSLEQTSRFFESLTKDGNTITNMVYLKGIYGEDLLRIEYEWTEEDEEDWKVLSSFFFLKKIYKNIFSLEYLPNAPECP